MSELITVEKIGDYKKAMKAFVKGLVKSKVFQDANGNLTITIAKDYSKELNKRTVVLTCEGPDGTAKATLTNLVSTRVYNKVDPTLFETLGEQLARGKNFGKLIVK